MKPKGVTAALGGLHPESSVKLRAVQYAAAFQTGEEGPFNASDAYEQVRPKYMLAGDRCFYLVAVLPISRVFWEVVCDRRKTETLHEWNEKGRPAFYRGYKRSD